MAGGTFTVTNLGTFGVYGFTPVLNTPQVGILGVGAIVPGPRAGRGRCVTFIPQIGLSLTVNHQVVDGAPGRTVPPGPGRGYRPISTCSSHDRRKTPGAEPD